MHCVEHSKAVGSAQASECYMNNNNRITLIIWNTTSSFENTEHHRLYRIIPVIIKYSEFDAEIIEHSSVSCDASTNDWNSFFRHYSQQINE